MCLGDLHSAAGLASAVREPRPVEMQLGVDPVRWSGVVVDGCNRKPADAYSSARGAGEEATPVDRVSQVGCPFLDGANLLEAAAHRPRSGGYGGHGHERLFGGVHGRQALIQSRVDAVDLTRRVPKPVAVHVGHFGFAEPTCCGSVPARNTQVVVFSYSVWSERAGGDDEEVVATPRMLVARYDPDPRTAHGGPDWRQPFGGGVPPRRLPAQRACVLPQRRLRHEAR